MKHFMSFDEPILGIQHRRSRAELKCFSEGREIHRAIWCKRTCDHVGLHNRGNTETRTTSKHCTGNCYVPVKYLPNFLILLNLC